MQQVKFKAAEAIEMVQRNIKSSIALMNISIASEYRKLGKTNKIVNISGIKMPIPPELQRKPLERLHWQYSYEREELKIVKAILQEGDRVMELGTGWGFLSTYCAQTVGSDNVFTYEANPALELYIRQVYGLNQVSPQVNFCLLGEQAGEQDFYVSKRFWASSLIQVRKTDNRIQVPVKPFNKEIKKNNPNVLIVDIEGGEYNLMQYADLYNIEKVIMEVHKEVIGTEKIKFVYSQLRDRGFIINEKLSTQRELYLERRLDSNDNI
ncbi:FkbM family methyltransferase [Spirulina sp. 06S082]|uniref:FkbM family methyltransferase n=1 Tax=Spirulina sp. 06S082 TaxID=3110248 RepID=UPI002B208F86|nr:FkbM family methyltransferase [Spirulina sp. 06S082]MEA5469397.1 FkbM family methyltransferase [Spirulina sp. 06S082]